MPTRLTARSASCIAKFWRTYRNFLPCNNTTDSATRYCVRARGNDVICPITQDTLNLTSVFKFVSATGHVHAYDAVALMRYLKTSSSFVCPCTRQQFTRIEIKRLRDKLKVSEDRAVASEAQTLLADFEMRWRLQRTTLEQSYRLLAIENQCGLLMTECLDVCSNLSLSSQEASAQLLNYLIPEWKQLVDDFMILNVSECKIMLIADREKITRLELSDLLDVHDLLGFLKEAVISKIYTASARERFTFLPNYRFHRFAPLISVRTERNVTQGSRERPISVDDLAEDPVYNLINSFMIRTPSLASLDNSNT